MDQEKKLHHANIIVGQGDCQNFVFEILEKNLNFKKEANPDFLLIEKESFGIEDARDLEKWAALKPFLSDVKVSLLSIKSITLEAQNALLKLLEEPTLGTYIFITLENLGGILPTFISRVRVLTLPENNQPDNREAKKFLASKIKEKFSIINSFSKKDGKSEMKELIKNLEEIAHQDGFEASNLQNILTAKIFASARGSSPKMLLEWLSCVLQ